MSPALLLEQVCWGRRAKKAAEVEKPFRWSLDLVSSHREHSTCSWSESSVLAVV